MPDESSAIQARLSTFDTAMVVFSLVVGIGIFRTPAIVAQAAGGTTLFFTAWILAGAVSLIGAFVFAEIGSRHPRAGGFYRVVADCYHPALAFMLNWSQIIQQGAGAAGVAFIGADYLRPLLLSGHRSGGHATLVLACAMMLVLLALNYRGVRPGARAQNLLSLLKIVLMGALVVCAFVLVPRHGASGPPAATGSWPLRLATALIPCFYSYGGYQLTMNLGADLRDARRRFPRAIAAGVLTVVTLYLLLNIVYVRVLGMAGVAHSKLVAAALTGALFGPAGKAVVSVVVFLSAAGFVNATIVHVPRVIYAMGEDGALPRAFMRVNRTTQAQEVGLLFFGATMLVPALLLGSFAKLLDYVMVVDTVSLAMVASTVFVLRRRQGATGAFAMWGYPVLPALYIGCLLTVCVRVSVLQPALALAAGAIFLTGWPLFRFGRRLFGPARAR